LPSCATRRSERATGFFRLRTGLWLMYPVCAVALNLINIQASGERPRETGAADDCQFRRRAGDRGTPIRAGVEELQLRQPRKSR
jgi:hypothetical protein